MFDEFIEFFTQPSPILWVSQICGILGFLIITVSYQFQKGKFLVVSGISYLFFLAESGFAGLYANFIVSLFSFVRNLVMIFFFFRKKKEMPLWVTLLLLATLWASELTFFAFHPEIGGRWENYLPLLLNTAYTLSAIHHNYYVLKGGAFVHETGYLVFFAVNGLPFSSLRQLILVLSILVSVVRMWRKQRKQNKE